MNMKKDIDKSVEELLEELDVAIDDNYDNYDDLFYDDDLYNEDSELLNNFSAFL